MRRPPRPLYATPLIPTKAPLELQRLWVKRGGMCTGNSLSHPRSLSLLLSLDVANTLLLRIPI